MRKYKTPFTSCRPRKTWTGGDMSGWFLSRQICIWVSCGGCMDCWLWKGDAANPGHSIVRCRASGPWNLFFFSVYMMCFSPMVSAQRTCCCSGSWELELISPGWDTELHCYKPSPDVTAIVMVTEHALQCQQLSKVFSFSLRFVLHTEYKLSSCWGWSERSY